MPLEHGAKRDKGDESGLGKRKPLSRNEFLKAG